MRLLVGEVQLEPASIYRELTYRPEGRGARLVTSHFEVVARPGEAPRTAPRAGDLLIRVALGQNGPGYVTRLAGPAGTTGSHRAEFPGSDGARRNLPAAEWSGARRVLDIDGCVPVGQVVLRPRQATKVAESVADWDGDEAGSAWDAETSGPSGAESVEGTELDDVRAAIRGGQSSESSLTNLVFFARHPERNGEALRRTEAGFESLSREWLAIRDDIVRPALRASGAAPGQSARGHTSYIASEVSTSRTKAGHLDPDVRQHRRGILIADFGVNWGTPKSALATDPELRRWIDETLALVDTNRTVALSVHGFSDCVGAERDNMQLRNRRARKTVELLSRMSGSRWPTLKGVIKSVGAAPADDYVASNDSVTGRAMNRGVLLQSVRSIDFGPDEPVVPCDTLDRIIGRSLEMILVRGNFGSRISEHQQQRIECWLRKMQSTRFDDRYITGQGVLDYLNRGRRYYANAKQWLLPDYVIRQCALRSDREIWQALQRIDYDVFQGRATINRYYATHGAATPHRIRAMRDWMAARERETTSIYSCYRG